jgi:FKBP-type peptidyl-prolyl cis-trans isomerase SlyD
MRTATGLSMGITALCMAATLVCAAAPAAPAAAPAPETIQDNVAVEMEYTVSAEGQVIDTTEGRTPFQYVHGRGQIVPGLERQLAGLKVGDSKDITVTAEEGYGPVDPEAFVEVPKTQLPQQGAPEVGAVLRGTDPEGRQFRAVIHEVREASVMLNLNHPLAGKTLQFKIKVLRLSQAA